MYFYGNVHNHCKAIDLGHGFCSGIWIQGSRGCEVYNDSFNAYDVVMPGDTLYCSCQSLWLWTNRSMDRYVQSLGIERSDLYDPVQKS